MAQKLNFDDGVLELEVNNNGILRFNASDFNVYQRLCTLSKELPILEEKYRSSMEAEKTAEALEFAEKRLDCAKEIDAEIKRKLAFVFGEQNDFDLLFNGCNLMAFGKNGERVITNFLDAILPYLEEGVKKHAMGSAAEAIAQAKKRRGE